MALVLKDRVKVPSTSTGTGDFTLSGVASSGYQDFSVIGDGNVTYYTIYDPASGDWEVGYGTYVSSGSKLVRDFVYDSSNSGNLVDFAAGTKDVFCTYPSEQAIYQETNGNLKLVGGVIGVTQDGTEGTTLPNTSFQAFTTGDYYMQANQQNLSSGAEASSDWVCTADNGSDTDNYMDMGMASSGYNFPGFSAQKANSGYILSTGSDLRLIAGKYGAVTPGAQDIVLIAGSTEDTEERIRVYGDTGNVNIGGGVNATDLGQRLQVVGSASISGAATFGSTVTLNADPSTALQAATKQYVDNAASTGIHIHDPCVSETSAALSAVYTQGGTTFDITDIAGNKTLTTSVNHGLSVGDEIWLYNTAGNGLSTNTAYFVYSTPALNQLTVSLAFGGAELTGLTNASGLTYNTRANSGVGAYLEASANEALPISGVSVSDRVLVYNQATGYWNGVYTVTALGAADPGGSKWKLTRATDANKYEPSNTQGLGAGDYFFIQSNSEAYVLTDPTGPVIIGYDTITYTLFSSVPAYTVNSPLSLVGTTLSLTTVPANLGGTSFSSYTAGDTLYAAGSTTINKLAIGSTGQTMIVAGGLPAWGALDMAGSGVSGVLPENHGGTNQSSYATGDTLYASATNTLSKLSGNTTTTKKYLNQTGTGSASQAPVWDTIDASDIASGTLAVARGGTGLGSYSVGDIVYASGTGTLAGLADVATGNVLLSGGTNTAPSYGKVNLGTHIAGTLPTANGGTGLTSFTANGVVYASSTSALTTGTALQFNGSNLGLGVTPSAWSAYKAVQMGSGSFAALSRTAAVASNVYFDGAGWKYVEAAPAALYQLEDNVHTWSVFPNGSAGASASATASMTLDASGNLGVGTATPTFTAGNGVQVKFSGDTNLRITSASNIGFDIVQVSGGGAYLWNRDNSFASFGTNNTERMRIASNGAITTTTRPTFNGNTALDAGNYNSYSPTLTGTGASGTWGINISGNAATVTGITNNANATGDVNALTTSGFYRLNPPLTNSPGSDYGQLLVIHGGSDTITQIYGNYANGTLTTRSGNPSNVGGGGSWTAWKTILDSGNYNSYAPTLTGTGASGTWGINVTGSSTSCSGNSSTATTLIGDQSNWASYRSSAVANMLSWKNYGNGHVIFDASNSTSPAGTSVNNTNAQIAWSASFPTLMGWNGANTYGVRVDSARVADSATYSTYTEYVGNDGAYMRFHWSGQAGQPTWMWGGNDPSNMYVYNPSNFSVNYATSAGTASAVSGSAKVVAWVYNGGIQNPATAWYNISSMTAATNAYTFNFTNAQPDANYSVVASVITNTGSNVRVASPQVSNTTSSFLVRGLQQGTAPMTAATINMNVIVAR